MEGAGLPAIYSTPSTLGWLTSRWSSIRLTACPLPYKFISPFVLGRIPLGVPGGALFEGGWRLEGREGGKLGRELVTGEMDGCKVGRGCAAGKPRLPDLGLGPPPPPFRPPENIPFRVVSSQPQFHLPHLFSSLRIPSSHFQRPGFLAFRRRPCEAGQSGSKSPHSSPPLRFSCQLGAGAIKWEIVSI